MIHVNNGIWKNKFSQFNNIILVGASASGKTSVFNQLSPLLTKYGYFFPKRYTTRKSRQDDGYSENINVTEAFFNEKKYSNEWYFYWKKPLPAGDVFYGFLKGNLNKNVYCCNNELIEQKGFIEGHKHVLEDCLIVQIKCSYEVRKKRLLNRSPELLENLSELEYRLKPDLNSISDRCDIILNNENSSILETSRGLVKYIGYAD